MALSFLRSVAKQVIPPPARRLIVKGMLGLEAQMNRFKSEKDVFSNIYRSRRWGGSGGAFHSGDGSADGFSQQYAEVIRDFMHENGVGSVVDLGCGDFRVGSKICDGVSYTGVDVVPELIEHNRKQHGRDNVAFLCRNIVKDPLPPADLCLVRQVFQHLSNAQILSALQQIRKYKYVIVTEHFPAAAEFKTANLDIVHGSWTRIDKGSAVFLDRPPFSVASQTLLLELPDRPDDKDVQSDGRGTIRTFSVRF